MTIARRGIFGMLAALPFVPKAVAAPAVAPDAVQLLFSAAAFNGFQEEFWRDISVASGRMPTLFPGERIVTWGADVQHDRVNLAPWGSDTLENVR